MATAPPVLKPPVFRRPFIGLLLILLLLLVAIYAWWRSRPINVDRGDGRSFIQTFEAPLPAKLWAVQNSSFESDFYRAGFVKRNVQADGAVTRLVLNRTPTKHQPNSGAEVQKRGFYHYGRYEVVMKPAKGSGVVSSFFTHTFHLFGDPHDEIDIEFLGKNTSIVSFNYFTNGKARGVVEHPLPFDAAEAPHLYAFEWQPGRIDWFIDGEKVHTATEADHPIPAAPQRVIFNIWTGSENQYNWHGQPTFENGVSSTYYCVSFQALGDNSPQCSDTFLANPSDAS